jgi:membrane protein YqaA with SNARE-associated domain
MRIFSALYARVMRWARHPRATLYLVLLGFAESSFFPVPPDVMLAPMSMARPGRAAYLALLTTMASVAGGMAGYLIGMLAFDAIEPLLHQWGYFDEYLRARAWFDQWGFWAILLAGFSPIPYKVFTITAGVIGMPFLPFVLGSALGRGGRFFLVALLMAWGGERMEARLHRWIDRIGWLTVGAVILIVGAVKIWPGQ